MAANGLILGTADIDNLYVGSEELEALYLGSEPIYEAGPPAFGIRPTGITVYQESASTSIRVSSPANWNINAPNWVSLSVTGGTSGRTTVQVNIDAYTGSTYRSGYINVNATDGSTGSCAVRQDYVPGVPYLDVVGPLNIVTNFNPNSTYGTNDWLKVEIAVIENGGSEQNGAYIYKAQNEYTGWFSLEGITEEGQGWGNVGNSTFCLWTDNGGNGLGNPLSFVIDENYDFEFYWGGVFQGNGNVNGNLSSANLIFFNNVDSVNTQVRWYYMKVWDAQNNLVFHFAPHPSGTIQDLVSGTVFQKTGSGTATYGREIV